jgi:hypothetical protein
MASPVKVSDRLLGLARREAKHAHRSATAQIEHWATLGRAVEAFLAYRDVLALTRAGQTLPLPVSVRPEDVHQELARIAATSDRARVHARIHRPGLPVYEAAAEPGMIVEVHPDGRRVVGRMEGRRFVPARRARARA